jgi:hypothetical protein
VVVALLVTIGVLAVPTVARAPAPSGDGPGRCRGAPLVTEDGEDVCVQFGRRGVDEVRGVDARAVLLVVAGPFEYGPAERLVRHELVVPLVGEVPGGHLPPGGRVQHGAEVLVERAVVVAVLEVG